MTMNFARVPEQLKSEILRGNCVAFVGAGFSAPAVPDWDTLLTQMAANGNVPFNIRERITRLLSFDQGSLRGVFDREAAAQILRETLGEKFVDVLSGIIRRQDKSGMKLMEERKRLLYEIPFQSILTTNFDHILPGMAGNPDTYRESLRKSREPWFNLFSWDTSGSPNGNQRKSDVVKLHGDIDKIGSVENGEIILSRTDYRRLLFEDSRYTNFLKALLATRTVLFLGFSFSDAYLNLIRSEILALLKHEPDEPLAYAIVENLDQDEADFLVEHEGVQPLIYNSGGGDHSGFDRYLEEIHSETAPARILGKLLQGKNVMWMDPHPDNNAYGTTLIRRSSSSGCNVHECSNPQDALEALSRGSFDLVISHWGHQQNVKTDGSRGANAIELLTGIRTRGIEVPVIVFASPDIEHAPQNRLKALSLGAFEYTWTFTDLFSSIERIYGQPVFQVNDQ